ncbi:unnamed protein product [Phaeothamnion confervicola]
MRITKKFTGSACLGKRVWRSADAATGGSAAVSPEAVAAAERELSRLAARFVARLERQRNRGAAGGSACDFDPDRLSSSHVVSSPAMEAMFESAAAAASARGKGSGGGGGGKPAGAGHSGPAKSPQPSKRRPAGLLLPPPRPRAPSCNSSDDGSGRYSSGSSSVDDCSSGGGSRNGNRNGSGSGSGNDERGRRQDALSAPSQGQQHHQQQQQQQVQQQHYQQQQQFRQQPSSTALNLLYHAHPEEPPAFSQYPAYAAAEPVHPYLPPIAPVGLPLQQGFPSSPQMYHHVHQQGQPLTLMEYMPTAMGVPMWGPPPPFRHLDPSSYGGGSFRPSSSSSSYSLHDPLTCDDDGGYGGSAYGVAHGGNSGNGGGSGNGAYLGTIDLDGGGSGGGAAAAPCGLPWPSSMSMASANSISSLPTATALAAVAASEALPEDRDAGNLLCGFINHVKRSASQADLSSFHESARRVEHQAGVRLAAAAASVAAAAASAAAATADAAPSAADSASADAALASPAGGAPSAEAASPILNGRKCKNSAGSEGNYEDGGGGGNVSDAATDGSMSSDDAKRGQSQSRCGSSASPVTVPTFLPRTVSRDDMEDDGTFWAGSATVAADGKRQREEDASIGGARSDDISSVGAGGARSAFKAACLGLAADRSRCNSSSGSGNESSSDCSVATSTEAT